MSGEIARLFATIGLNTTEFQKGLTGAKAKLQEYGTKINDVSKAITGFDAASLASTAGIAYVVNSYKQAISTTMEYTKEVRDLSRTIGATPEDVSKLI